MEVKKRTELQLAHLHMILKDNIYYNQNVKNLKPTSDRGPKREITSVREGRSSSRMGRFAPLAGILMPPISKNGLGKGGMRLFQFDLPARLLEEGEVVSHPHAQRQVILPKGRGVKWKTSSQYLYQRHTFDTPQRYQNEGTHVWGSIKPPIFLF